MKNQFLKLIKYLIFIFLVAINFSCTNKHNQDPLIIPPEFNDIPSEESQEKKSNISKTNSLKEILFDE
ncbi:MAG: hypothetical protein LW595_01385 [Rickettsiales bacterium]|jgi:hypothetical protein|nr:hypothetical protein [Rickettsiales bacterium]